MSRLDAWIGATVLFVFTSPPNQCLCRGFALSPLRRCVSPSMMWLRVVVTILLAALSVRGSPPSPTGTPGTELLWSVTVANWENNFERASLCAVSPRVGGGVLLGLETYNSTATQDSITYVSAKGKTVWSRGATSVNAIHSDFDVAVFANVTLRSIVEVVHVVTGETLWSTRGPAFILSATVVAGSHSPPGSCTIVVTFVTDIVCYDALGAQVWSLPVDSSECALPVPAVPVRPLVGGGQALVAASRAGVICVDVATGVVLWAWNMSYASVYRESVSSEVTLVLVAQSSFTALNTSTGAVVWQHTSTSYWPNLVAVAPAAHVVVISMINPNTMSVAERKAVRPDGQRRAVLKAGNNYPSIVTAFDLTKGTAGGAKWTWGTEQTMTRFAVIPKGYHTTTEAIAFVTARNLHVKAATDGTTLSKYGPVQDYNEADPPVDGGGGLLYFTAASLASGNVFVRALRWGTE